MLHRQFYVRFTDSLCAHIRQNLHKNVKLDFHTSACSMIVIDFGVSRFEKTKLDKLLKKNFEME